MAANHLQSQFSPRACELCTLVRRVGCQIGLGERLEHACHRSRRDPQRLRELSSPHRLTGRTAGGNQRDRLHVILDGQAGHSSFSSEFGNNPGGPRIFGSAARAFHYSREWRASSIQCHCRSSPCRLPGPAATRSLVSRAAGGRHATICYNFGHFVAGGVSFHFDPNCCSPRSYVLIAIRWEESGLDHEPSIPRGFPRCSGVADHLQA